jgi:hypothetical protein
MIVFPPDLSPKPGHFHSGSYRRITSPMCQRGASTISLAV